MSFLFDGFVVKYRVSWAEWKILSFVFPAGSVTYQGFPIIVVDQETIDTFGRFEYDEGHV